MNYNIIIILHSVMPRIGSRYTRSPSRSAFDTWHFTAGFLTNARFIIQSSFDRPIQTICVQLTDHI